MALDLSLIKKSRHLASKQQYVPIIIPVDFCNGLGQLRSHGRKGIKSIGLTTNLNDVAIKSRFCISWLVESDWVSSNKFMEDLIHLGEILNGKGYLSITQEDFFKMASEFQEKLEKLFIMPVDFTKIVPFQDKELQLRTAEEAGLSIPKTTYLDINELPQEKKIKDFRFPVFIRAKENSKPFYSEFGLQGMIVKNYDDLIKAVKKFRTYPLIIQEYISGDDSTRYFFGSLTTKNGVVHGYCYKLIRAVRQHGSAALVVSINNEVVRSFAEKYLRYTNYIGASDIAFKYDEISKQYYFIEINNRFWKSHSLSQAIDLDLPYWQYLDTVDKLPKTKLEGSSKSSMSWWLIFADIHLGYKLIRQKKLTIAEFVRSIGIPFVSGIGSWDDPMPEIYNLFTLKWSIKS